MNNYSTEQLQKIVDDAPEGAEFWRCQTYIKNIDENTHPSDVNDGYTKRYDFWYQSAEYSESAQYSGWEGGITKPELLTSNPPIKLSDIRAELLARQFKVGDLVVFTDISCFPSDLLSVNQITEFEIYLSNGMSFRHGLEWLRHATLAEEAAGHRIDEPKQKYDWSNVPDVVNWLATDKDGDCAWGFLEEPVIELEDEEWRPVAPYTEIYINGSNGNVAAHKGDWRESLEQRKFKIGDKVTFIRNIEPFQWGAKAKVYEVVDVADNLPTSTDQRVWLDTTASSPHLSRNLCLATAISRIDEPASSCGMTAVEIDQFGEDLRNKPYVDLPEFEQPDSITAQLDPAKCRVVDPTVYDAPTDSPRDDFDAMSESHRSPACHCREFPIDAELKPDAVNHPAHYTSDPSGIECIEITRHRNFNVGNAIKYLWRAGRKDQAATVQDLQKAIWYINDEIARLEGEQGE